MATEKHKKVLLVNYAGYFLCANTFIPDNSLGALAAMLKRQGVPVEIVDLQSPRAVGSVMDHTDRSAAQALVEQLNLGHAAPESLIRRYQDDRRQGEQWLIDSAIEQLLTKISSEDIGLVGFKLWAGEGILGAVQMAEAIRSAYPKVTLVAGGPAVEFCGNYLLELTRAFDQLVPGEGEYAIAALACQEPGHSSSKNAGLITREALTRQGISIQRQTASLEMPRVSQLDDLPFATYDREIYPNIDEFYKFRILDETRGCFNQCAFCSHTQLNGHGTRRRRAVLVVDEIERLQKTEAVNYFRFSGSNPPWRLIAQIAEEILKRKLDVCYSIFASMNNVNPDIFGLLHESGLRSMFFGIESGDFEQLERAHKKDNVSREHVVRVSQAAMQHGIFITLSFIVPAPFETAETKRNSLNLIGDIFARQSHGSILTLPPFLMPGTQWWNDMAEYGFEFTPGMDRRSYILHGMKLSNDYLLPRDSWSDYGYLLHGKTMPELLAECGEFVRQVEQVGALTHIDDAAYMLALMGNLDPREYKNRVLSNLILGGAENLDAQVREMNKSAVQTRERVWMPGQPRSNAA